MKNFAGSKFFDNSTQGTLQLNQFDLLQRRRQKPTKSMASMLGLIALSLASLNVIGSMPKASSMPALSRPPLPTRQEMAISGVPQKHQLTPTEASPEPANPQIRQPIQSRRTF